MPDSALTPAEERFRLWMYVSAWMYAVAGTFFLVAGRLIAPFVNGAAARFSLALPPYPLPSDGHEGAFWLVLSLSMMAMITYICRAAYINIRRNANLIPILLLSKFCSSALYLGFFIATGNMVHLVGMLTDGPLFLATLLLWIPASPGALYLDQTEEDIYLAVGEAIVPRGGAFEAGFEDYRNECMADARRLFAALSPVALVVFRLMLRLIDFLPLFLTRRFCTFRRLPMAERQAFMLRMEHHPNAVVRMSFFAVKLDALMPLFNQPDMEHITGWDKPRDQEAAT